MNSCDKLVATCGVLDIEAMTFAENITVVVMSKIDAPFKTSFEKSEHYCRYFSNFEEEIVYNLENSLCSWYEDLENNPKFWVASWDCFVRFLQPYLKQLEAAASDEYFLQLCTKIVLAGAMFEKRGVGNALKLARMCIYCFTSKRFKFGVIKN